MVGLACIFSLPVGIMTRIFLSEFGGDRKIANVIRFMTKILSSVPSIIVGVFAYGVIVLTTKQFSAVAGGFALGTIMLPVVALTAEESLKLIPKSYRLASAGLGCDRFQTTFRIVLPAALPAITTGVLLAVARVAGETAPLLFTALSSSNWPDGIFNPTPSLSVSMEIYENQITAIIGSSGCGKSTFLKALNRIGELEDNVRVTGSVEFYGQNIYDKRVNINLLRRKIGMVFQRPNPFPISIYDNVIYGVKKLGRKSRNELDEIAESALRDAALWEEVKDSLNKSALGLSGGQQQRLCIARALAVQSKVLLMDEPCSALDPISTTRIRHLRKFETPFQQAVRGHSLFWTAGRVATNF